MKTPDGDRLWSWVRFFLEEYLPHHRGASFHTVASYRTCFRLLRDFLQQRSGDEAASHFPVHQLQPALILDFLGWLESSRGRKVSARTRNCRLAAIKSFFRLLELYRAPEELTLWQRLRQLPFKRAARPHQDSLENYELEQVLAQISPLTHDGFRDLTLLTLMYNTGARADEVATLHSTALWLNRSPTVRLMGKGRLERVCPLWEPTACLLERYLKDHRRRPQISHAPFVFINQRGARLTRFGVGCIVKKYFAKAAVLTPSMKSKRLSAHSLRHTTAIHLLDSGADVNLIKAWLGHQTTRSTSAYLDRDLEAYRQMLETFRVPTVVQALATKGSSLDESSHPLEDWLKRL